jgi:hypothetical protein
MWFLNFMNTFELVFLGKTSKITIFLQSRKIQNCNYTSLILLISYKIVCVSHKFHVLEICFYHVCIKHS